MKPGEKVQSVYGLSGVIVAITHPSEHVFIEMSNGKTNRCSIRNFDRLYIILPTKKRNEEAS